MISPQQISRLVESYFTKYSAVRHQIESFDTLTHHSIPKIIEENKYVEVVSQKTRIKHVIEFSNTKFCKPKCKENDGTVHDILPQEAHIRRMTYLSAVFIDLKHEVYNIANAAEPQLIDKRIYKEVCLFKLPVMLGSLLCHTHGGVSNYNVCPFVPGGYFIINGNEKVILPQEKLCNNKPYIMREKTAKYLFKGEVRSWHESKIRSTSTSYFFLSCTRSLTLPQIFVELPFMKKNHILLPHVFKVMGIDTEAEMREIILLHNCRESPADDTAEFDHYIRSILKDDHVDLSVTELYDHIGKNCEIKEAVKEKRIRNVENVFNNEFFPHMGLEKTPESRRKKAIYMGYVVMKLLRIYHESKKTKKERDHDYEPDDRDDYANKRLDTVNMLVALQFRQLLRNFKQKLTKSIHKATEKQRHVYVIDMMKSVGRITTGINRGFSTGSWNMSKVSQNNNNNDSAQTGVSQLLTRMTPMSTLSHMRRINTPLNRDGKLALPRQLHHTCWGLICSSETPEGIACGLIKNLALLCHIRLGYSNEQIEPLLPHKNIIDLLACSYDHLRTHDWIFLNGTILGVAIDNHKFVHDVRELRRCGDIPFDLSIAHDVKKREIRMTSDAGCCCRPVFVLANMYKFQELYATYERDLYMLWDMMLAHGVIEYIDKDEERTLKIALTPTMTINNPDIKYTHMEISCCVIMGIATNMVPFSDFDQAPRNTYGACMSRQGIGKIGLDSRFRYDTAGVHELMYPQRPLVSTFVERALHFDELPWGQNLIVALMCFEGYNQEDSIIASQSAIDRGMGISFYYRVYKDMAKSIGTDQEIYEKPTLLTNIHNLKRGNYDKLNNHDALVDIGEYVEQNDMLIGKTMSTVALGKRDKSEVIKRDKSMIYKSKEPGYVDGIISTVTKEGASLRSVRIRSQRVPAVGDKFSSRHGQKGVISLTLHQHDMPYICNGKNAGLVPDLIINPHCQTSRMTIGHLLETLVGKVCCEAGEMGNGTPFNEELNVENARNFLHQCGLQKSGNERLCNPKNGEMIDATIFMGCIDYMRLKHMVVDKVHGRRIGPRQIKTQQPAEGRSRGGGLRVGEMEKDCMISHGARSVLRDRLLNNSDRFETVLCRNCGLLGVPAPPRSQHHHALLGQQTQARCIKCKQAGNNMVTVVMPCAFRLFHDLLQTYNVEMQMDVEEED